MLSIFIQAGGNSSRMGQNKALMPFLGRPLIERIVERVRPIAGELCIVTHEPGLYEFLGVTLIGDIQPGKGKLGGLYTALKTAKNPFVSVVACDMPFVNAGLLKFQHQILVQSSLDVVIPRSAEGLEPQHAVYRKKSCLPKVEKALKTDQMRMISWFEEVKVREIGQSEIARFDPYGTAFINVNTPEEFRLAEDLAQRLEGAN